MSNRYLDNLMKNHPLYSDSVDSENYDYLSYNSSDNYNSENNYNSQDLSSLQIGGKENMIDTENMPNGGQHDGAGNTNTTEC